MRALLLVACAGCSSLIGVDDFTLDDAAGTLPPGDGGPIGAMIRIDGRLQRFTSTTLDTLVPNTSIGFARDEQTVAATSFSTSDGSFSLEVPTEGRPVNGFVFVNAPSGTFAARSFLANMTADVSAGVTLFDTSVVTTLASNSGASQNTTGACLLVDTFAEGVRVTSTIGAVRYVDTSPLVASVIATATGTSGRAWVFDIPPGSVTVSASLLGVSIGSRTVTLPAGTCGRVAIAP